MRRCILKPNPGSGLLSLFNNVVCYLEQYHEIEVQWDTQSTLYYNANIANLWNAIAYPLHICKNAKIMCTPIMTYTWKHVAYFYLRDDGWRERLNYHYNKITLLPEIYQLIDKEIKTDILKESIAIHYRSSTSIATEQLTDKIPTIENIVRVVNRISRSLPIFIACDSNVSLAQFKEQLGNRVHYFNNLDRVDNDNEYHFHNAPDINHVQLMMAQTIALSRCKHLVHGVSNIATAALYINPQMTNTFIQG